MRSEFAAEDDVVAGLTIVHPGAAAAARRWPAERFAEVAAQLRREGHRVVITGGNAERSLAEEVAAASGAPTMLDLPLLRLLAVVAAARLVVCGDTGIGHVASNYRTPSVAALRTGLAGPMGPAGRPGAPGDLRRRRDRRSPRHRSRPSAAADHRAGGAGRACARCMHVVDTERQPESAGQGRRG